MALPEERDAEYRQDDDGWPRDGTASIEECQGGRYSLGELVQCEWSGYVEYTDWQVVCPQCGEVTEVSA